MSLLDSKNPWGVASNITQTISANRKYLAELQANGGPKANTNTAGSTSGANSQDQMMQMMMMLLMQKLLGDKDTTTAATSNQNPSQNPLDALFSPDHPLWALLQNALDSGDLRSEPETPSFADDTLDSPPGGLFG